MGYDVHITRKSCWSDDDNGNNISIEEWKKVVNEDPEMRLDNAMTMYYPVKHQEKLVPKEGFATWMKEVKDRHGNKYNPWFDYRDGNISVKNPEKEVIAKMLELANKLGALVQGDDEEYYDEAYLSKISTPKKKPWWRFF